jgi:hypothetical protein
MVARAPARTERNKLFAAVFASKSAAGAVSGNRSGMVPGSDRSERNGGIYCPTGAGS